MTYKSIRKFKGCYAALSNAKIIKHMNGYLDSFKKFTEMFLRDLYVNDSTVGVNTIHEAIQFNEFIKGAMQEGGFNLREWFSNCNIIEKLWLFYEVDCFI